jgi:hypothetical protein
MTARVCYDWSPLGYHEDPIPGDPDQVDSAAKTYASTADTINQVSDYLANLDSNGQQSLTIAALVARSRELSGQLVNVSSRYSATAAALRYYAPELRASQAIADSAIAHGAPAEAERKRAASNARDIQVGWLTTLDPTQAKQFEESYTRATNQADTAATQVGAAKAKILEAIRRRDQAADVAKSMISSAIENSPVTDTTLDKFKDLLDKGAEILTKVGKWIWDNIDQISFYLTIASAVLGWVPFLGPALIVAAKVANILATVKSAIGVAKSVAASAKSGDWSGAILTGGAFVVGLGLQKLAPVVAEKLGGATSTLVGKAAEKWNLNVRTDTKLALNGVLGKTYQNGVVESDIAHRVANMTTDSRPAIQKLLSKLAKSPNDVFNGETIARLEATTGTMKGTDIYAIQEGLDHVSSLSSKVTFSASAINDMQNIAGGTVNTIADKGLDKFGDLLQSYSVQRSSGTK